MKSPQWIIDMMISGKPVKCRVGNHADDLAYVDTIVGYMVRGEYRFMSKTICKWYKFAEPLEKK